MLTCQHHPYHTHDGRRREDNDGENGIYILMLRGVQLRVQIHEPQHVPHVDEGKESHGHQDDSDWHPSISTTKTG